MPDKKWHKLFRKELIRGRKLRNAFMFQKDDNINKIFSLLSQEEIMKILNEGDIDYPSKIGFKLLIKEPRLAKYAYGILKDYL